MQPLRRDARGPRALLTLVVVLAVALTVTAALQAVHRPASRAMASPAVGSAAAGDHARPDAARRAPNVVVVMADDMRVDEMLFAPRIRRLVARDGLTFDNSFSPYPLCCPARASFLTGQYAHNHQVFWHEKPFGYGAFDDSRTLATSMRRAGYRTGFIGKYLNRYGLDRSRVSGRRSHTYVPRGWDDWRGAVENPGNAGFVGGTYNYMSTPFNMNGRVVDRFRGRYQSNVIGDLSVDMARDLGRDRRPFFMYVNYVAPHFGGPREPGDVGYVRDDRGNLHDLRTPARPPRVRGRFDRLIDRGAGLPRGGGPSEADISDKPRAFRRVPEPNAAERRGLRDLTRQRAESIHVMDQQVGRLIRSLKRSGEWSNTVFAFTSDNGYFLGEHRRRSGKVRAHEPSLRVPLVITGPGMRSGAVRHDPITTIDFSATILALGGARAPRPADGTSRLRTLLSGDQGWSTPVLTEATNTSPRRPSPGFSGPRTSIGVRTARWSWIRNRTGEHELYDLLRDPLQLRNVARDPGHADVRRELDGVWWDLRNCRQAGCRVPLPVPLRTSAATTAAMSGSYWRTVHRVHGFGGARRR